MSQADIDKRADWIDQYCGWSGGKHPANQKQRYTTRNEFVIIYFLAIVEDKVEALNARLDAAGIP